MTYTAAQAAEVVACPYRTLMYWVEEGLLNPEGACRGRRYPTTWHPKDMREASMLAALRRAGFSLQKLKEAVAYLRSLGQNPMSTGKFIVIRLEGGPPSELIKLCETGEAIELLQRPGQLVMPLWTPDPEVAE